MRIRRPPASIGSEVGASMGQYNESQFDEADSNLLARNDLQGHRLMPKDLLNQVSDRRTNENQVNDFVAATDMMANQRRRRGVVSALHSRGNSLLAGGRYKEGISIAGMSNASMQNDASPNVPIRRNIKMQNKSMGTTKSNQIM